MKKFFLPVMLIIMCGTSCDSPDLTDDPNDLALTLNQEGAGCTNFEVYTWNTDKSIFVVIKGTILEQENDLGTLIYDLSSADDIEVSYDYYGKSDGEIFPLNFNYCNDVPPGTEIYIQAKAVQGTVVLSFANIIPHPEMPSNDTFTITITLSDVHFDGGVVDYISSLTLSDVYVGWRPG